MPCSKRFTAALQETTTSEDGVKMYTWRAVRRQHLRVLRKQTRSIVFFMALLEVLRVGPTDIVYAGKHGTKAPGPEDYGISYNVGHFMAWLYLCAFAVVFVPLSFFGSAKLTDSNGEEEDTGPTIGDRITAVLDKVNSILIPTCIGLGLVQHVYYTISTFIYVDERPVDPSAKSLRRRNSCRNWLIRALLLVSILFMIGFGKAAFVIFEQFDLARVKPIEYLVIVLPIQINLGILLGSGIQFKVEQRQAMRAAARKNIDAEAAAVNEKEALIVMT